MHAARDELPGVMAAVNVLLSPNGNTGAARAGMLSPRGRCHTFDRAADGYVRAEGCGAARLGSGTSWRGSAVRSSAPILCTVPSILSELPPKQPPAAARSVRRALFYE